MLKGYAKKKFLREVRRYHWDEPYLYKHCADGIYRRSIAEVEVPDILFHCHGSGYAEHFTSLKTVENILQAGLWWPTMFRDAHTYIAQCYRCQTRGKISKRHKMKQNFILEVKVFDYWGIDFMGPFPSSNGNKYILVSVDYVSNWVEAYHDKKIIFRGEEFIANGERVKHYWAQAEIPRSQSRRLELLHKD
ncbi:hypothetical protein N665_2355s0002 [Sinapis alba]|nr:hypothetical protein N665_2355s0002 [Sinapis alba]